MNDMTPAGIGHNGAPDPIEAVTSAYDDLLMEVANWTDGAVVENEAQHDAVADLLKQFKTYKAELTKAGKERTEPLHKAWKAEVAAVKVYTDDAERMQSALVACVAPYKAKLAEEKRAEERAAWEAADKARREAEAKAAAANAADLEAQREAAAAKQAAMDAQKAASAGSKDQVKGMRTVHHYEVESQKELLNWIIANDRPAMVAFLDDYARRNHRSQGMAGVKVWTTKEAF
ncbi:hypothetical protein [Oceaniglobus trochenteri]|uniref:hypothetical protein n=1 Tax=Oceaniglobus trochenteri TaxID=2763260 RepID=UPI001CFF6412|nr:hypothetical protein [Oceaniglobus trochenteri]